MKVKRLAVASMALLLLVSACDSETSNSNNGDLQPDTGATDTGETPDAEQQDADDNAAPDAEPDAAPDVEPDTGSGCLQLSVSSDFRVTLADGVSIEYSSEGSQPVEGQLRDLSLLFERYGDTDYVGTYELGPGRDENFGNCAHCVFMRSAVRERAYFADRGTLVTHKDPFKRTLDVEVSNLRLIEVEVDGATRASTPIEGGRCIEVADFTQEGVYPPENWTCLAENYRDGENCNCGCGAWDPDCATASECFPGQPECGPTEELPIVGCEPEEMCLVDPVNRATECAASCDYASGVGCDGGDTCVFDFGPTDGDVCLTAPERIAPGVDYGEECPDTGYQVVCRVIDGFATGFCTAHNICRPLCKTDSDCTVEGETCRKFEVDGTLGYCGPVPTDPDGP